MSSDEQTNLGSPVQMDKKSFGRGCLDGLQKNALMIIVVLVVVVILFSLARAAIYKIRPYERGLHLRGGAFVGVDQPGWHIQIPFVDTVISLIVIERGGTIEKLAVMTSDQVTMDVSLLYTYRVEDPVRYQLEVLNPEAIVAGFVQGTLRDVVNTRKMDDVMQNRPAINQEVMKMLQAKEDEYGIKFVLVQIQSASPPSEVVAAIKDRMVAVQQQEQAERAKADDRLNARRVAAPGEGQPVA